MRLLLALVVFLPACQDDALQVSCTSKCYTGPENTADRGACRSGTVVCDAARNIIGCENEVHPVPETCNGIDDDCDGQVDVPIHDWPMDYCLQLGVCTNTLAHCYGAAGWGCPYPSAYYEANEETRCDGLDNDCNGVVDDLPAQGFCYSGPVGTEQGECRPGWLRCESAQWICNGEVLPSPELPCNAADEDCDGEVDEGFADARVVDVMLVVDISGSISTYLSSIVAALDAYGTQFVGNPNFRWSLVTMSEASDGLTYRVEVPFGDIDPVRARLRTLTTSGGTEPSIDVAYHACAGDLGGWRPEAERVLVMFADEQPQTVENRTLADAGTACADAGVVPHVWTTPSFATPAQYGAITDPAGGATHLLTTDWQDLLVGLQGVIGDTC